ncbi:MAG: serine/threonine-protein kinase [Polyangiaceae bacterium]
MSGEEQVEGRAEPEASRPSNATELARGATELAPGTDPGTIAAQPIEASVSGESERVSGAGAAALALIGAALEGRYRVDALVGEGGFGVVYRGWHIAFDQPIAIKCLKIPLHYGDEARNVFLDRFRQEAALLSKLSHPAIVRVFDFGVADAPGGAAIPYMVLEWFEGQRLDDYLRARGGPLTEDEARTLLRGAVEALAFAHEQRPAIAHRDIKPANVFVLKDAAGRETTKVLDFGVAKAMQEGEAVNELNSRTSSGFSAFSPSYGAPEQFRSKKFGESSPRTDVHAIGLLFFELVAGRPALRGEELADFMEAATAPERPTPRRAGVEVSDVFESMCARAVALQPRDRFATAGELLSALDNGVVVHPPIRESLPSSAEAAPATATAGPAAATAAPAVALPPTDPTEPASIDPMVLLKQARKRQLIIAGVIAAILLIGSIVIWVTTRSQLDPPSDRALADLRDTLDGFNRLSPDLKPRAAAEAIVELEEHRLPAAQRDLFEKAQHTPPGPLKALVLKEVREGSLKDDWKLACPATSMRIMDGLDERKGYEQGQYLYRRCELGRFDFLTEEEAGKSGLGNLMLAYMAFAFLHSKNSLYDEEKTLLRFFSTNTVGQTLDY